MVSLIMLKYKIIDNTTNRILCTVEAKTTRGAMRKADNLGYNVRFAQAIEVK